MAAKCRLRSQSAARAFLNYEFRLSCYVGVKGSIALENVVHRLDLVRIVFVEILEFTICGPVHVF